VTRRPALTAWAVAAWLLGVAAPGMPAGAAEPPAAAAGRGSGDPAAASVASAAGDEDLPRGPVLTVDLAPGPHTVGDRIEAVLTLSAPADDIAGEPRFPDWGEAWGEADVLTAGAVERVGDGEAGAAGDQTSEETGDDIAPGNAAPGRRARFRQRLVLAAFRTGEVPLPPVAVAVPAAGGELLLRSPEGLALAIDSVLPPPGEDGEPAPMPPAPPRPLPLGARFWWTAGSLAAACALALAWALARRRRAAAAAAAPAPPPFEELRAALAAARGERSPAAGHAAVSLAFRRYLGRVLRFPAAESSTAEIRRELARRNLPDGAARPAAALLAGCDLVKFARREATAGQLAERAGAALGLATEIEAHLRPVAPAAAGGAGAAGKEAA